MMHSGLIAPHVQAFFAEYLCSAETAQSANHRQLSRHIPVIADVSARRTRGIEPSALRIADVDAPAVLRFLDVPRAAAGQLRALPQSPTVRASARSSAWSPCAIRTASALPRGCSPFPSSARTKKLIGYLTRAEMQALLAAPDRSKWSGRRDHALLLTLYNSGARVSEITALQREQVCFGVSTFVQLTGKGRKERTIPLWPTTAQVLRGLVP